jgi:hypothetical protein
MIDPAEAPEPRWRFFQELPSAGKGPDLVPLGSEGFFYDPATGGDIVLHATLIGDVDGSLSRLLAAFSAGQPII